MREGRPLPTWARLQLLGADWKRAEGDKEFCSDIPVVGEQRAVQLARKAKPKEVEWLLFEPAKARPNGFGDAPNEMQRCAIARVVLDPANGATNYRAARVTQVVPVSDFRRHFPDAAPCRHLGFISETKDFLTFAEAEPFHYYRLDSQGDVGAWAVIEVVEEVPHLLLYGERAIGRPDRILAGHGVIGEELWSDLQSRQ